MVCLHLGGWPCRCQITLQCVCLFVMQQHMSVWALHAFVLPC